MDIILTPDEQDAYSERIAIMIIDAHLPEQEAERLALEGILKRRGK
jgi:hypothetical protein